MLKEIELLRKFIVDPEAWVANAVSSGVYKTEEEAILGKLKSCIPRCGAKCVDSALEKLKNEPSRKEKQETEDLELAEECARRAAIVKQKIADADAAKKLALREEILKMKEEGLI